MSDTRRGESSSEQRSWSYAPYRGRAVGPVEPVEPVEPMEPLGPVETPEPGVVDVPEPGFVDVPEPGVDMPESSHVVRPQRQRIS